jgi:hypothetical protein
MPEQTNNKPIEIRDLEAYSVISAQRFLALEERVARAEKDIQDIVEQSRNIKRITFTALLSMICGLITLTVSTLINKHS